MDYRERDTAARTVTFGDPFAMSKAFQSLFDEGMALVEEAAAFLDGPGREQSRFLPRIVALAYSTESMRLTTRLMQFMEPYAAMATLRRRICTDGELEAGEGITQAPPGASPLVRRIPAILVLV